MKVKFVFFDFDGTLVDSNSAIVSCMEQVFKEERLPPSRELSDNIRHKISLGLTLRKIILDTGISEDKTNVLVKRYREIFAIKGNQMSKLFPAALETVSTLAKLGVQPVMLSNKGQTQLEDCIKHFGLGSYFVHIFGERDGWSPKPQRDYFDSVISGKLGKYTSEQILMVGDTEVDLKFAKAIGAKCAWASYGFGTRKECLSYSPDYVIDNLNDLLLCCTK